MEKQIIEDCEIEHEGVITSKEKIFRVSDLSTRKTKIVCTIG